MGLPATPQGPPAWDPRLRVEPPSRVFTVEEADGLLPALENVFRDMDLRSVRLREVTELVQDLEEYWGTRLADAGCPDHGRYAALVREREDMQTSLSEDIGRIHALGVLLKDFQSGLVDFFGVVDGRLAFLCWRRGEPSVQFYHTIEGGFAGRKPLAPLPRK